MQRQKFIRGKVFRASSLSSSSSFPPLLLQPETPGATTLRKYGSATERESASPPKSTEVCHSGVGGELSRTVKNHYTGLAACNM